MKYRPRVPGHGACLESISRTVTMQDFMIQAVIGTEKDALVCLTTRNSDEVNGA